MSKTEVEKYYIKRAEDIVDVLFDKGYFREDVTRKEMKAIDELLGYFMQSSANSAVEMEKITRQYKKESKS